MTAEDLARIESELGVALPAAYKEVMQRYPFLDNLGSTGWSLWDDCEMVIQRTREYRQGFASLPPWPERWVYIGDDDDACPYALDTESGRVLDTDHGALQDAPLGEWTDVAALVDDLLKDYEYEVADPRSSLEEYNETVRAYRERKAAEPAPSGLKEAGQMGLCFLVVIVVASAIGYGIYLVFLSKSL